MLQQGRSHQGYAKIAVHLMFRHVFTTEWFILHIAVPQNPAIVFNERFMLARHDEGCDE